ncbi:glycosyltransferase family 2 protein [Novipirellula caenicola]|uniref:Glycosyltransferase 2-like domain-containing protein n=1 Tax=Novipirellula caenicola TaxID=1536901 RepID=A0ABP9VY05_9BACT
MIGPRFATENRDVALTIWPILTLAITALCILIGLGFIRTFYVVQWLSPTEHAASNRPRIDVIVPARNEQDDIGDAIRSILAQQDVDAQITVINDHSTDQTGAIADSIAENDPRVRVLHDPPLADGWFGKANAMQHAYRSTNRHYVVFADADVIHSPRCFITALQHMQAKPCDFLSLFPNVQLVSFWENAIVPHLMVFGLVTFLNSKLDDPDSPHAVAAGAFMLTHRDVLDTIGGLSSVRNEALDDVMLARNVKAQGFKTCIALAPQLLSVRLFKNNRDAFWGFSKNILGAVSHIAFAFPAMLVPIVVYWIPITVLLIGLYRHNPIWIASGLSAYVAQAAILVLASRLAQMHPIKALAFPLSAIPIGCCFARAIYHHVVSDGVVWRGRVIRRGTE